MAARYGYRCEHAELQGRWSARLCPEPPKLWFSRLTRKCQRRGGAVRKCSSHPDACWASAAAIDQPTCVIDLHRVYVVTSSFTLAKCIRDRQEEVAIVSRVDHAGLDKLLAEQDLLRIENQ